MKITATVKFPEIKIDLLDKTFYQATGLEVARSVIKRTQSGKDVDGASFKPYSKSYAAYRAEKGRQVAPVNLTFSAKMLNAIKNEATDKRARVFLTGNEGFKAYSNEHRGRRFFNISQADANDIIRRVDKWMTAKNGLK